MAKVRQVETNSTETPYRRGSLLLGCFEPGKSKPRPSHHEQVIKFIIDTTKELKEKGIQDPTPEDYAKHLRMKGNLSVVTYALLFCANDPKGKKLLNEILDS